jgi:diacylglycerol kinase (CTP)
MVDMDMSVPEEDEQLDEDGEDREVEKVLYALGKEAVTNARASSTMNSNGHAHPQLAKKPKPDLEIPRKVLHASIGSLPLFITISVAYHACLSKVFSPCTYTYRKATSGLLFLFFGWPMAVIVPADFLRFRFKGFARTYEKLLGFLMRESERVRDSQLSHST